MPESVSFEYLEAFHRERLERFARRMVFCSGGNKEDAEDVYVESRFRAWKHFGSFDHKREYYAWRCKMIQNIWIDERRRRNDNTIVSLDTYFTDSCINEEGLNLPDPDVDIEGHVSNEDERVWFWKSVESSLGGHNPVFWQCIKLRFLDGLGYEEIAKILNCPLGTAKSRLYRAIRFLRSFAIFV